MKKVRGAALSAAVGAVVVAGLGIASVRGPIEAQEAPAQTARKPIQIDLSQSAQKVRLNQEVSAAKGATAARFPTVHGAGDGWALRVAGNNPRSPAAQDGVVVVGTGSGNTVFGVEVETGLVRWSAVSKDSGISSVIVAGDSAYFTTWSCTLERVRVSDGHHEFSKWLASTVECAPDDAWSMLRLEAGLHRFRAGPDDDWVPVHVQAQPGAGHELSPSRGGELPLRRDYDLASRQATDQPGGSVWAYTGSRLDTVLTRAVEAAFRAALERQVRP